jgi:hypothetical protein
MGAGRKLRVRRRRQHHERRRTQRRAAKQRPTAASAQPDDLHGVLWHEPQPFKAIFKRLFCFFLKKEALS